MSFLSVSLSPQSKNSASLVNCSFACLKNFQELEDWFGKGHLAIQHAKNCLLVRMVLNKKFCKQSVSMDIVGGVFSIILSGCAVCGSYGESKNSVPADFLFDFATKVGMDNILMMIDTDTGSRTFS